ncbi:4'-phosphopantetheinyl transferase family protein [Microbacterium indicum]|uniref:4'-phosphopantetheinyl transferase family protein n=1 Tax=Microbacterium indicum TaxID=358100 RepID=UPI0004288138|nr:hypothetical protein [Microbacterium indicum]
MGSGIGAASVAWGPDPLALVRSLVGDPAAEIAHACPRCGSAAHGRPFVAGSPVPISISYADGLAIVAAAPGARAVGIDIERADDTRAAELGPLFAPEDPPSIRDWTRIEAAVKADGRGLRISPAAVVLSPGRAELPGGVELALADAPGPDGYVASLALLR